MANQIDKNVFQLQEVIYSEKNDAPREEDGCEICQHCFDRPKLTGRVQKNTKPHQPQSTQTS